MDQIFDFSSAALLVGVAFGLTQLVKKSFPEIPDRLIPAIAVIIGLASTIATANSDWGDDQIVGKKALASLNGWSLALVGMAVGVLAIAGFAVLKTVANIGQNKDGKI